MDGSSSSSPSPSSGQSSPLDQQAQGQQGQKEKTPQGPGQEPQQQPDGEPQQAQNQGQPDSPRENVGDASNQPGDAPVGGQTERGRLVEGNERWGDLPIHVRDLFRTEGGGDLPPQYRDWIDSYYRRLNRRP